MTSGLPGRGPPLQGPDDGSLLGALLLRGRLPVSPPPTPGEIWGWGSSQDAGPQGRVGPVTLAHGRAQEGVSEDVLRRPPVPLRERDSPRDSGWCLAGPSHPR